MFRRKQHKQQKSSKYNPPQIIKRLVLRAIKERASDIHLEANDNGLVVRFRIDGLLRKIETLPPEISRQTIVALKVMAEMDITIKRKPQDGRACLCGVDLRINCIPSIGGENAVIRLFARQNSFNKLENLGLEESQLLTYKSWLQQPQGIILITGPTGAGKTSTLYSSLKTVATDFVNVITIENPIEYVLPNITQMQVNEKVGMTLASGLRAILHQDPDVIMLGEIRDRDTAETAIQAALTGHLVLTTLHTNDALSALPRLKSLTSDPGLINNALLGVVAQRLVRKVCPHCGETYMPTDAELDAVGLSRESANLSSWRRGRGCSKCGNTGYLGRVGVFEMLDVDRKVRRAIDESGNSDIHRCLDRRNFSPFQQAAIEKLNAGVTTVSEILRVLPRSAFDCYHREERATVRGERLAREPIAIATESPKVLPFALSRNKQP